MNDSRPIIGYEGSYTVFTDGVVWSTRANRALFLYTLESGYQAAKLWTNGKRKGKLVHTLVLEAFVGPRPADHECRHINGIVSDNRLSNLEWAPRKDRDADGRGVGKLLVGQVKNIRALHKKGMSRQRLAERYKVCVSTIGNLVTGKSWSGIS